MQKFGRNGKFNCEHLLSQYLASLCSAFNSPQAICPNCIKPIYVNFPSTRKSLSSAIIPVYSHAAILKRSKNSSFRILWFCIKIRGKNGTQSPCKSLWNGLFDAAGYENYLYDENKIHFFLSHCYIVGRRIAIYIYGKCVCVDSLFK